MANTIPTVPAVTKAQWLMVAQPVMPVLAKGDVVSVVLVQQLLVDALAIVQTAP